MVGETVYIQTEIENGEDPRGNPTYTTKDVPIDNVLISPGETEDTLEEGHPDGDLVTWTLQFPKTFEGSLRGLKIKVYDEYFDVIGDPRPYPLQLTPTMWNMTVRVGVVNG